MENNNPKVSIITITFNLIKADRERTFRQCIESVHNQTYKNIEHIIIDGSSVDGTIDLIKEYEKKGWIKYISEPDAGIYDAMNKGIKMANGKFIAFLNSDDYYHNKKGVEVSVDALQKTGADYSFAPATILGVDEKIINYHPHMQPHLETAFFEMPFCHQTMFTKRETMLKEGMFDTFYKSAGDYDFLLRLLLNKNIGIKIQCNFVTYRLGGLSGNEKTIQISKKETAEIYQKNYQKYFPIDFLMCKKIQQTHILPRDLSKKLSEITGMKVKIKQIEFSFHSFVFLYKKIIFFIINPAKIKDKFLLIIESRLILFKEFTLNIYRKLPLPIKNIYRYFKLKLFK